MSVAVSVEVREEPTAALAEHGRVPIAFEVRAVLDVRERAGGMEGLALVERALREPWVKDYDAHEDERPAAWSARFDVSRWGLLAAYAGARRVGGVVVARDTPGVEALRGRRDLAVVWDLRVADAWRRRGVGAALFAAAAAWAAARGCARLEVETQNVNVPACRFYARQGCRLGAIDRLAYPALPDETRLVWYRPL